jgi:rhodanese-related sulfurtransferase
MTCEVWFKLVDAEGNAVALSADRVKDLPDKAVVVDVRDAVKDKFADSHLAGIAPSDLTVFAHQEAYDAKQALPKASSPVTDLGKDEDHPLIVQVPAGRLSCAFVDAVAGN